MIYLNTTDVSHEQPNDLCKIEKCYDCLLKQKINILSEWNFRNTLNSTGEITVKW
jgi:hypothetical protein